MWFLDGGDDDENNQQPELVTPEPESHGGPAAGDYTPPPDLTVPGEDQIDDSQLG